MTTYEHTQFGGALVYPLLAVIVILIAIAFVSPITRIAVVVALPLVLVLWIFSKMTITIDQSCVRASFGSGFVYKDVPIRDIESVQPIRLRWWYGWGIHLTPYGWLYNVSGWDAINIRLRNGKQLCLGTDQPAALVDAILHSASAISSRSQ